MSLLHKKYYDVSKLVVWSEPVEGVSDGKRPRLIFSFRDGNPRIVVNTGAQGMEGMITFPCDYIHLTTTMNMLKDIANGPVGDKFTVDSLKPVYEDNKPTNQKQIVSTLQIGKTKEGIVYFMLIAENKPKIVFPMKPSPYHVFRDGSKEVIPDAMLSKYLALSLANLVLEIVADSIMRYTDEEYLGGKKQGSTERADGATAGNQQGNKNIIQDIDDLVL